MKRIVLVSLMVSWLFLGALASGAEEVFFNPQLIPHAGKAYVGTNDPDYVAYESTLRAYMVRRIYQRFGVELDPKKYSGFDLLEIESFFECKKADEPFDLFLKLYPR